MLTAMFHSLTAMLHFSTVWILITTIARCADYKALAVFSGSVF